MAGLTRPADSRLAMRAAWLAMVVTGTVSARLGGWFAATLWFTPWRLSPGPAAAARERAWLEATTPLAISAGGRSLAGWEAGEGPTVVLVHGWGERAARLGAFVEPLVSRGLRVVGVDLPGHGASPAGPTDLYALSAAVRAAAEEVGARAVLAHSVGALSTLMAMRDGLSVTSLALVAPSVRLEHALEKFATMFKVPPRASAGLRAEIERRFGPEVWQQVEGDRIAEDLTVPGLVVHDRQDPQVDLADARLLARAWRGSRLVETDGLGHLRVLRDEAVLAGVADFLAATIEVRHPV